MPIPHDAYKPQSVRDLIAFYFGAVIPLRPNEKTYTVGTTAVAVGAFARQRVAVTFSNPGSNAIQIGFNPGVTTTNGLTVPAGGSVAFMWFLDGELVMEDFWAIAGSASQNLYVLESVLTAIQHPDFS